ncbi:hypothetical protein [Nitrosomonas oligotropha]|uniref:Uncharacterized protein n=1 Tax=Nitrosomonas oligotropha TaxID=42354 RepID=A0A1H8Q732_9PROT|nr:hypothetical protein [Nitrosomonas oligotropha]SDW70474.1 hypothetical protein SAMN05216300_10930 [Nitrosomonas oligotropha]SEO50052.1 hypothetical protein SAMN05216333_11130 [Nitrosomonas oligotropha]
MLEAKDPVIFKEYFSFSKNQAHEKKELINNKFSSLYNIRIGERLCRAIDFVSFYSKYAFAEPDEISTAMGASTGSSANARLLMSIKNNQGNMRLYEKWVLLACNLD